MGKVYCKDCKFYRSYFYDSLGFSDSCKAIVKYRDTYFTKAPVRRSPSDLNKNNDCPYYKPKLLVRWGIVKSESEKCNKRVAEK